METGNRLPHLEHPSKYVIQLQVTRKIFNEQVEGEKWVIYCNLSGFFSELCFKALNK